MANPEAHTYQIDLVPVNPSSAGGVLSGLPQMEDLISPPYRTFSARRRKQGNKENLSIGSKLKILR